MSIESIVTDSEAPTCLTFIAKQTYPEYQAQLSNHEQRWLKHLTFDANHAQVALLPSPEGALAKVLVGFDDQLQDSYLLAKIIEQLPAGDYQLSQFPLKDPTRMIAILYWVLHQYRFQAYKKSTADLRRLVVDAAIHDEVSAMARAYQLTRDLINTPTQDLGPKELSLKMQALAEGFNAHFQEVIGDDLLTQNFPCIHAVGRASAQAPRLLELTWGDTSHPRVCLLGKGVCFDSGGLDIKPANAMRYMKKDMGGAAHVMGLAHWIMENRLPIHLQVLIPAVENSISADSYRPGDVLSTRKGISVEVDNTDAEGRLVMCDALTYAQEQPLVLLIDFATLTGAARIAVGTEIAAMFSNDDSIAKQVFECAQQQHDPVWQLPLYQPYRELLKSSIADISNSASTGYAGASTAALFLNEFINPSCSWMHFDVMAYNLSSKPGKPEGGEALGLRAVYDYLKQRFQA